MVNVPFYLVWREGGGEPVYRQTTLESAQAEADRLARINPGDRFFVLVPACSSRRADIERVRYDISFALGDDGVPF